MSLAVLWLNIRARLVCRLLGHRPTLTRTHGYRLTFCERCWASALESVQ